MWHNKYGSLKAPSWSDSNDRSKLGSTKGWIQNQPFKSLSVKRHRVWTWWICPAIAPWSCSMKLSCFSTGKLSPHFQKKIASSEKEKVAYQEINSWHPTKANNKTSQKWQIPWSIPSKKYHELPPVPTVPTHPPCLDHHFESYPPGGRPGESWISGIGSNQHSWKNHEFDTPPNSPPGSQNGSAIRRLCQRNKAHIKPGVSKNAGLMIITMSFLLPTLNKAGTFSKSDRRNPWKSVHFESESVKLWTNPCIYSANHSLCLFRFFT